jgi:ATP-dependent RNA helicase DOB1
MAVLANKGGGSEGGGGGGANKRRRGPGGGGAKNGGETDCFKIVKMIMERNFAPVIVFSFSKKECEAYALQMAKLDFNTRKLF